MRATALNSTRSFRQALAVAVFASLTLGLLGGCTGMKRPPAVAPPPVGNPPPQARDLSIRPTVPPRPKKVTREVRTEDKSHIEKPEAIDPKTLLGLDPSGVEKRLGTPARMENGTLSRKWIYASSGCSFSVFFYPNVNSTSFRVLKYGDRKSTRLNSSHMS